MAKNKIPQLDLSPEIDSLWEELTAAMQRVLRSGQFIMGGEVGEFEAEVANYLGIKHAIAVNSGTDALVIGLRSLGIGPGDEVITTPFAFFATAEAVSMVGASPVFADIDPATFNLAPALLEAKITPRTKAILVVHLYGQATDMSPVLAIAQQHGLKVIEDAAQSFGGDYQGEKLSTIGDVGALSFFPSKTLGAYGDAGMIVTNNDEAARTMRMLRTHGAEKKYFNEMIGYNSRMDTLQAAILRVKLPYVEDWNEKRRQKAQVYNRLLRDTPGIQTPHEASYGRHVYHQYTIRVLDGKRDAVQRKLAEQGISTTVYYPLPIHKLPVYANIDTSLPCAEQASAEVLSLPMWPQMDDSVQEIVANSLKAAF